MTPSQLKSFKDAEKSAKEQINDKKSSESVVNRAWFILAMISWQCDNCLEFTERFHKAMKLDPKLDCLYVKSDPDGGVGELREVVLKLLPEYEQRKGVLEMLEDA